MQKYIRTFLPPDYVITDWTSIQPFYSHLLARDLSSLDDLRQFLADWSELEGALEEDAGWRYIRTSCNTTDAVAKDRYEYYITAITPHLAAVTDQLHQKVLAAEAAHILRKKRNMISFFERSKINCVATDKKTYLSKLKFS